MSPATTWLQFLMFYFVLGFFDAFSPFSDGDDRSCDVDAALGCDTDDAVAEDDSSISNAPNGDGGTSSESVIL